MAKIYIPLVLVLALIIGALAYVKHFHTLGFNMGVAKTKIENQIIVNQNVQDMVDDMLTDDFENYDRMEKNESVEIPVAISNCTISADWLQNLGKLK